MCKKEHTFPAVPAPGREYRPGRKKTAFIPALIAGIFFLAGAVYAQQSVIPVIVDGDEVNYVGSDSKVTAHGNVSLKYEGITITCDDAAYFTKDNLAQIKGNVVISSEDGEVFAEEADYDFARKTAHIIDATVQAPPFYGHAHDGEGINENEYVLREGYVSTCDLENPHYRLKAKKITIYPNEKVVARNVVFMVGKVPLFYLPYLSQPLNDSSFPVELSPGKYSDWGYYLLSRFRYNMNEENRGKVLLDFYETRGTGFGLTHKVETDSYGEALINLYSIEDQLYHREKRDELFEEYSERQGLNDNYFEDDRYKTQVSYTWNPSSDLSIRGEFHKFSDKYFMKDFFYREYEIEDHPYSYFLVDKSFGNSSLSFFAQKRANHFFTETEYLPRLQYDLYRQNIMPDIPLYLESETSLGSLTRKTAYSDVDDDAVRLHSHNVLSYEQRLGWLVLNPYTGLYSTYYSKNNSGDSDIMRIAPEAGITFSTELYKRLDWSFSLWGEEVSRARHVITPKLTFGYIHDPTTAESRLFDFDSIDNLQRKESVIFELRNKIQVKNDERQWDFLYFSPSVEYKIDNEGTGSYFDNIKADLEVYPTKTVSVTADSRYDCRTRAVREANIDLGLHSEDEKYSVSAGHRYARNESSQTTLSSSVQLNPQWRFSNYLRYEFRKGEFKEQEYVLRRDLHCWWMDLGLNVDDNRDFTIWVIFRVKAFPDAYVGFEQGISRARDSY